MILRLNLNMKSNVFPKIIFWRLKIGALELHPFHVDSFDAYLFFFIILSAANFPVMIHVGVPAGLYAH